MGDEGSANARSCQMLPGVTGPSLGLLPGHSLRPGRHVGSAQRDPGQGCGELEPGPAMGMRLERAAKHQCKL